MPVAARPLSVTVLILALAAGGATSSAAPARDAGAATAAGRALAAGRAREALALYKRAAREQPRAELWCGVGLAHERLRALPQAHAFLTRCLASSPRQAGADRALRRVTARLEVGRFAPVAFEIRPSAAALRISPFAADEPLFGSVDLWLPFGTHKFTVDAPGHEKHTGEVVVDSNSRQTLLVELRRTAARSAPAVDFGSGDGPAVDAPITSPDQRPLRHDTLMPDRFRDRKSELKGTTTRPPAEPARQVARVLTWNLKRLGHGVKRMDLVARLLATQDVAVLQEVMSPAAVRRLLAYLPGWRAAISPRAVGRRGYAEHYAVLYRADRVRLLDSYTVADRADEFVREPFVVCLKARAFDFCVVTIHVVFGRLAGPRNSEVEALGPLLDRLMRGSRERDWIVAGDFNRPARAACWSPLRARGWTMTAQRSPPTSISARGYRNDYDHLLINPRHTREWTRQADRIDFVSRLCRGNFAWCLARVSDHAPVHATFSTRGPDDD